MLEETLIKGTPRKILRFIFGVLKFLPFKWSKTAGQIGDVAKDAGLFNQGGKPKF